jgi:small-conductance mechanosensitive channel
MKIVIRIMTGCALAAVLAATWAWGGGISHEALTTMKEVVGRILNASYFTVGNLPVTPLFLLKTIGFLFFLGLGSHLGRKILRVRILARTSLDQGLQYALSVGTGYLIFFVGLTIGLQSLGLNLSSLAFLGGAIGIGIGVGLQAIVNNFVSGLILLAERPIKVGDRVEIEKLTGDIIKIAARSTWVRTNDNVVIIVPNSEFTSKRVTNWTANDRSVRITVGVGTSYESDPEQVRQLLLAVAGQHPDVLDEPAPDVVFTAFGNSSLDFELRVWTTNQVRTPQILQSDLNFSIFKSFKQEGVEIPYPQRDLHLRSISVPIQLARTGASDLLSDHSVQRAPPGFEPPTNSSGR